MTNDEVLVMKTMEYFKDVDDFVNNPSRAVFYTSFNHPAKSKEARKSCEYHTRIYFNDIIQRS